MERIPIAGPWITEREIRYVSDAVARCWYDGANEYVRRFERAAAEYLDVPYTMALPSCTSAIHLSLLALGVGPGDEVLVPDVTWIATAAPISYVGATPQFIDIDPDSWCISPAAVEEAITARTKAVIAVDLYGNVPDYVALRSVCDRYGLPLIEDAAEAIGTKLDGTPAGAFGDLSVFSFHGSKTVTTGEGGLLATRHRDYFERICVLRDHGRQPGDCTFFNREVAFKYKMSDLQAALGLAQLERVEELVARKQEIMSWYRDELKSERRVSLNPELDGVENSFWMVTVVVAPDLGLRKEQLIARLAKCGIDTRPFFYPLSQLPAYANTAAAALAAMRNRIAQQITPYGINLPSAMNITRQQVTLVANALRQILDQAENDSTHADAA